MGVVMLRCFPEIRPRLKHDVHPILHWMEHFPQAADELPFKYQIAMAKLIPLLLCGEQSALFVFNKESARTTGDSSTKALAEIEADESLHESALQMLLSSLPVVDSHRTKRLAQKFYASLEKRTHSIAEHFLSISKLDACVCIIMHEISKSSIRYSYTARLFEYIKNDEARHVKIAKTHANLLNPSVSFDDGHSMRGELINLLSTQKKAFEELDVDFAKLSRRIVDLGEQQYTC